MNKLREKLTEKLSFENNKESEKFITELEQITDDFAVKFYHWLSSNEYIHPKSKSTTELLQIFKNQYYE